MTKYVATGRALVYRHGNPKPIECTLEQAKDLYCGQPGYEVYGVMAEADRG
jgi:hypothetical protein